MAKGFIWQPIVLPKTAALYGRYNSQVRIKMAAVTAATILITKWLP